MCFEEVRISAYWDRCQAHQTRTIYSKLSYDRDSRCIGFDIENLGRTDFEGVRSSAAHMYDGRLTRYPDLSYHLDLTLIKAARCGLRLLAASGVSQQQQKVLCVLYENSYLGCLFQFFQHQFTFTMIGMRAEAASGKVLFISSVCTSHTIFQMIILALSYP
jgi:hypothetical protein